MTDILNIDVQELEDIMLKEETTHGEKAEIVVYNDDFNTFDWVIECFMDICNHSFEQSEQLSILVHYKGRAAVKTGLMPELKPLKEALVDRGLSAVIETFAEK